MIPLDLSKKHKTRCGWKVVDLHKSPDGSPLGSVLTAKTEEGGIKTYYADGSYTFGEEHPFDLVLADPPAVVHPISAEHPLVPGDQVRHSYAGGLGSVHTIDAVLESGNKQVASAATLGLFYECNTGASASKHTSSYLTRIAHAPQPEARLVADFVDQYPISSRGMNGDFIKPPTSERNERVLAAADEWLKSPQAQAQLDDVLAEADRMNPRIMQATDERVKDEYRRRTRGERIKSPERLVGMEMRMPDGEREKYLQELLADVRDHERERIQKGDA